MSYVIEGYWEYGYADEHFTFVPSYSTSVAQEPRVLRSGISDKYEQFATEGINIKPKAWDLSFNGISPAGAEEIIDYLKMAKSWTNPFLWVDPDGVEGRYKCKEWNKNSDGAGYVTLTCKFQEVFW